MKVCISEESPLRWDDGEASGVLEAKAVEKRIAVCAPSMRVDMLPVAAEVGAASPDTAGAEGRSVVADCRPTP